MAVDKEQSDAWRDHSNIYTSRAGFDFGHTWRSTRAQPLSGPVALMIPNYTHWAHWSEHEVRLGKRCGCSLSSLGGGVRMVAVSRN